ncbi:MAG: DUF411 domain-containing protein [Pseudomonadota bacterium]
MRRMFGVLVVVFGFAAAPAVAEPSRMTVFKSASCGCCGLWIDHLAAHGFEVEAHDTEAMHRVKELAGVPPALGSCHTAMIDGYVIEGHVPAAEIRRLLDERPAGVAGLSVPGMPQGSPGMPAPAAMAERYDVVVFGGDATGRFATYAGERRVD